MKVTISILAALAITTLAVLALAIHLWGGEPVAKVLATAAPLAVEVIKAISWPGAILLLASWFKDEIRAKIVAMTQGKVGGTEFLFGQLQQSGVPLNAAALAALNDPVFADNVEINALAKKLEDELGNIEASHRIPLLCRRVTEARMGAYFEFINNIIFGSQINALRQLAQTGSAPVSTIESFFNKFADYFPDVHAHGFQSWLSYLLRHALVEQSDTELKITQRGYCFLKFLDVQHPGEVKAA